MDITAYQHNFRISTRGKRPLRNLTPGDKVRAIQRIHNGETKASVSRDIGVPESTLRGWCKNEQKLRFMCRQLGAAINDQGMSIGGIDNPPEKRSKLVKAFDYNHSYGYDRLGSLSSVNRLNATGLSMDSKNNCFISNNVIEELIKKNGTSKDETNKQIFGSADSAILQGIHALSAATNYSQLPLIQNMNVLSFLNSNLAVSGANAGSKSDGISAKTSLCATAIPKEAISKPKKQSTPVSVKSWAHESLCSPLEYNDSNSKNCNGDMVDTNDSNNNDVRPTLSMPQLVPNNDLSDSSTLFPIGMPLPPIPMVSAEARTDVLLQWSKVFNASLSFLALATAAAAIQCPTSVSPSTSTIETKCDVNSESPHTFHNPPGYLSSYTPPIFEPSEDSNFESEPEDLSVRSGTSKVSSSENSRPQSTTKDLMSDSLTLSDEEQ